MPSPRSLILTSTLVATALAQSTSVTSLFLYGYEGENIVASVVSAAPAATTYFVGCAEGTDATDCGFGGGVSFVSGPSTLGLHFTEAGAFTEDVDCAVASQTASCVQVDAGDEANSPGTQSVVLSGTDLTSLTPVTITAGLELLSSGASVSATTSGSSTSTTAASGASATDSAASKTASATKTASSSGTSASASATGAASRASGIVALAGVVGLVGMAMVV